mmetsp:Transcript_141481/g.368605  ORF Transcript_141481/g.368605 Transcript_141481/m.368605 type:complete len:729 (-) Transcript_141481:619-2805(-)|eukprot:CAMPEP_0115415308 /NCGR_PEP_ID=MMETSP0271-20121206/23030_1 /TAXON_ID=71861 /ORGANISM="Scrippsiella trochoidea, Strain CCMP3099" /LENGTH=728 /DNA_ID=CAMNT_0002839637 /DNA_START=42 /DNA_END=2228 /DNA_ORIENTATION=+
MELQELGDSIDVGVRRILYQLGELPAWVAGQSRAELPLGLVKGDSVHVWSNPQSRWIEDGIVQDGTEVDTVVNGTRVPAGALKVRYNGGAVQWILPTEAREILRKIPRPVQANIFGGSWSSPLELQQAEQQYRASGRPFTDMRFSPSTGGRVTAWLRPREVTRHGDQRLCAEVEMNPWDIFAPAPIPQPLPNVDWQLFRGTPSSDDVQQGELGDCWFLSSLAALAEFQDGRFLKALIPGQQKVSNSGAYVVRLCLGGVWRDVLIDDRLPCIGGGSYYTQFAYCVTKRLQLWASLVEKGFAKACGSYEALRGGEAGEALEMLTGWPCTLFIHGWHDFDAEVLWATLCSSRDAEFLMTCSTKRVRSFSLESDHVYSLMNVYEVDVPGRGSVRLLKIRNPNTKTKWQGDWSDASRLWTPHLRQRFGCPEGGNPHVFFMSYDDFLNEFAHCTICRIRSNEWHETRHSVQMNPGQSSTSAAVLEVFETTECSVSLAQPGRRLRGGPYYPHLNGPAACIGFILLRVDTQGGITVAAVGSMRRKDVVSTECWLEPGRYLLVPLSLHTGPSFTASWACFSSRRVAITQRELQRDELRGAWVAYAKETGGPGVSFHGATLHMGKAEGGCVVAYAENPADLKMHLKVDLTFSSDSLQYSRSQGATVDWLAPGQGQILNVAQPNDSSDGKVSWRESHTFSMTESTPGGPLHRPGIPPNDFLHVPFSFGRGETADACVVQ